MFREFISRRRFIQTEKKNSTGTIRLSAPIVEGQVVKIDISAPDHAQYIRSGTIRIRYEGFDPAHIPPEVLLVPVIGSTAPAAIALGAKLKVPYIDADLEKSMYELAKELRTMYSGFASSGFLITGKRRKNSPNDANAGDLLLYSGGVDALSSLLANRHRIGGLLSIWGADVPLNREDLWDQLSKTVVLTDVVRDLPRFAVKTNVRKFFRSRYLVNDFAQTSDGSWWMRAQHGAALLAHAAPLAYAKGYPHIIIASSHTNEFSEPWGSGPLIDSLFHCAGIKAIHDGYALTRQAKVSSLIAPYVKAGEHVELAICYKRNRGIGSINCGHCEKCYRTATAFMATGVNPSSIGLTISPVDLTGWRAILEGGEKLLTENEFFMWTDIQNELRSNGDWANISPEVTAYLHWLVEFDLSQIRKITRQSGELSPD